MQSLVRTVNVISPVQIALRQAHKNVISINGGFSTSFKVRRLTLIAVIQLQDFIPPHFIVTAEGYGFTLCRFTVDASLGTFLKEIEKFLYRFYEEDNYLGTLKETMLVLDIRT